MYTEIEAEERRTTTRQPFHNDEGIMPLIVWMMIGMAALGVGFVVLFK